MIASSVARLLSSASLEIQWIELRSCDQGSGTAVAPGADASGFRTSGGHNTSTGITDIVLSSVAVAADGYQEAVLWYSEDLLTLIPDFDPTKHDLLIEIDKLSTPPGTVELNLWAGVLDGQPSGTASGCCFFLGHGSAVADNSGIMGATTNTFSGAGDNADVCTAAIQITSDAGVYETRITGLNTLQDLDESGGANWGAGQALTGTKATWKICWGIGHRSTDSMAGLVATFKVRVAKVLRASGAASVAGPTRGAKPATGGGSIINVVIFGDSIGDGQGGQTATGAVPAYVNLWDDAVSQANWPNTNPVPQAGHAPRLAQDLNAAGWATVKMVRRALSAQEDDVTLGQYLRLAISDCRVLAGQPDIVVFVMGTNDCQTTAERDIWERRLRRAYAIVEASCPNARILHMEPIAPVTGSHTYIAECRAVIRSLCAASPSSRAAILGDDLAHNGDGVHPSAASYNTQASRAVTAYLAM